LLIDDATSGDYDAEPTIRCIEKGCQGMVLPFIFDETDEIGKLLKKNRYSR